MSEAIDHCCSSNDRSNCLFKKFNSLASRSRSLVDSIAGSWRCCPLSDDWIRQISMITTR